MRCLRHRVTKEEKREEKERLGERRSSSTVARVRTAAGTVGEEEKAKQPTGRATRPTGEGCVTGWLAGRAEPAKPRLVGLKEAESKRA